MIPKTTSIFWFAAWRIGLIVLFLSLVGYIVWLQRYTFTDQEVSEFSGLKIFRARFTMKEGQKLCMGQFVDGSHKLPNFEISKPGARELTIGVGYADETLTVATLFRPPFVDHVSAPPMSIATQSQSLRIHNINANVVGIWFNEQPDGSVWLAEWVEEKEGQKKKIKYGYWIE